MAAQQGFVYEENAVKFLKPLGLVPKSFVPAGAGHDQPDLMLLYNNREAGCELKITAASAGSLVMKYNPTKKSWGFADVSKDKEKQFISELADFVGLWKTIKQNWKQIPYKIDREFQDDLWKAVVGKIPTRDRYERDRREFKELSGAIPATKIEDYYARKDTHYVNVGTHGFYLMGHKNPYKLKDVPRFGSSAKSKWRARVQYKGSGNYQFTFEMSFSMSIKSKYNIAPIQKGSVNISKGLADISCFPDIYDAQV